MRGTNGFVWLCLFARRRTEAQQAFRREISRPKETLFKGLCVHGNSDFIPLVYLGRIQPHVFGISKLVNTNLRVSIHDLLLPVSVK